MAGIAFVGKYELRVVDHLDLFGTGEDFHDSGGRIYRGTTFDLGAFREIGLQGANDGAVLFLEDNAWPEFLDGFAVIEVLALSVEIDPVFDWSLRGEKDLWISQDGRELNVAFAAFRRIINS